MASLKAKFLYTLKNLKSDAVPQAPRPETTNVTETNDSTEVPQENIYQEEEVPEAEPTKKESKQSKSNIPFFSNGYKKKKKCQEPGFRKHDKGQVLVNTQAGGDVMVIANTKGPVHIGPVFNMEMPAGRQKQNKTFDTNIEKSNVITLLLEAKIKPEHEYIDYISKNLGKDWHSFFRALGYSKGRIETMEIDQAKNGVSEARYKLLLDWVRNDDDGTLGRLATKLWEEGEREVVKELAIIYKANRKCAFPYIDQKS